MQKGGMLNSSIAKVLADLGHTDTIVIGDCGLPVPAGVQKIDLALKPGTPSFLEVVEEVARPRSLQGGNQACQMHYPHRRNYSFCQCDSAQQCFLLKISVR